MSDADAWPAKRAQARLIAFLEQHAPVTGQTLDWDLFDALAREVEAILGEGIREQRFVYEHPAALQPYAGSDAYPYQVRMSTSTAGDNNAPLVLCMGGIANAARRFDLLARHLGHHWRVVALDWAGRGRSGWLRELSDYGFDSCVAQVRALLDQLGGHAAAIIGSSLGGSVAIRLASERPESVERLVLNDVGAVIPVARRAPRARVLGRHYVFARPAELFRRAGAAQKQDGPVEDAVLLHNAVHMTRWSEADGGRVYRHDLRALLAYREEAAVDLDLRADWDRVRCPVLLLHGMLSDNLIESIWRPMVARDNVWIRHVPQTGHTPVLSDAVLAGVISDWLAGDPGSFPRSATLPLPVISRRVLFPDGP